MPSFQIGWDPNLPGSATFQALIGTVGWVALALCIIAMALGAGKWAIGSGSNNAASAASGQKMVVGGVIGVIIIGALAFLVPLLLSYGASIH